MSYLLRLTEIGLTTIPGRRMETQTPWWRTGQIQFTGQKSRPKSKERPRSWGPRPRRGLSRKSLSARSSWEGRSNRLWSMNTRRKSRRLRRRRIRSLSRWSWVLRGPGGRVWRLKRSRRNCRNSRRRRRKRGRRWRRSLGFRKRMRRGSKRRLRLLGLKQRSRNVKGLRRSKRLRKPWNRRLRLRR